MDGRSFEPRESRALVLAWPLMSLIIVASVLGAFGGGPLSRAEAADSSGALRVEYERISRFATSSRLQIFANGSATGVAITLDRALLDAFHVRQILPTPQSSRLAGDGVEFVFARDPSTVAPIIFELESRQTGTVGGTIRSGNSVVALRQFILP